MLSRRATTLLARRVAALAPAARSASTRRFSSTPAPKQQLAQAPPAGAVLPPGHIMPASGQQYLKPLGEEMNKSKMFCNQCSQHTKDCGVKVGNCRKTPEVARLQDEIVVMAIEIGHYAHALRQAGKEVPKKANDFTLKSMFSTLTNVNNEATRLGPYLDEGRTIADELKALSGAAAPNLPPTSIMAQRWMAKDPNASSLCEMLMYGLKGVCAYADHALVLGKSDPRILAYVHEALAFLATPEKDDLGKVLAMCLRAGEANLWTMELLYEANSTLGTPEPTQVQVAPVPGKCVLVSGHDLHVTEALLKACEPLGIKVYTHGELLPAHSYPELKKYKSLAGHFGGAWNRQQHEFQHFPGPIVMTSNCLIEPHKSYAKQIFNFGVVGWPGAKHLGEIAENIDWTPVTKQAQEMKGFSEAEKTFSYDPSSRYGQPSPTKPLMVGFGHETVLGVAGTVLKGVEAGAITRFYLIGGCDGDAVGRNYYTDLSENVPDTSVILTLGCGKFRISEQAKERLGNVGDTGIPRVLDMGQCNDTFSAIKVALGLADALKCKVSDLPLSIVLSWYEQKAIAVLLTCLHLGLKPIRVGPVLPAFVTKDVLDVLVKEFGIIPVGDVQEDIKQMTSVSGAS